MDPLTLCLKRQRTQAMLLPLATPDWPLTTPCQCCLYAISLTRGMRVVLLVRGVETHRGTGAVKGSNSIFLFSHFPLSLFFLLFALLSFCCICEIMSRIFLY